MGLRFWLLLPLCCTALVGCGDVQPRAVSMLLPAAESPLAVAPLPTAPTAPLPTLGPVAAGQTDAETQTPISCTYDGAAWKCYDRSLGISFAVPTTNSPADDGELRLSGYDDLLSLARSSHDTGGDAAGDDADHADAQVLYEVIMALLTGDGARLSAQMHYMQVACTDIGALGGPPLCRDGEPVGTVVDGLPLLEAEGVMVRADEMQPVIDALLARRPAIVELFVDPREVYCEEGWHPAHAGVLLVSRAPDAAIALLTDARGIVRIYYGRTVGDVRARVLAQAR